MHPHPGLGVSWRLEEVLDCSQVDSRTGTIPILQYCFQRTNVALDDNMMCVSSIRAVFLKKFNPLCFLATIPTSIVPALVFSEQGYVSLPGGAYRCGGCSRLCGVVVGPLCRSRCLELS